MKEAMTVLLTVATTLAFANGGRNGDPGDCFGALLCSSRRAAEFEQSVNGARRAHPSNVALAKLESDLAGKSATEQKKILVTSLELAPGCDETTLEKALDRKLNDGSSDKLTNQEVRTLVDVLTGTRE